MDYLALYNRSQQYGPTVTVAEMLEDLNTPRWNLRAPDVTWNKGQRWINENTVLSVLGKLNIAANLFDTLVARAADPFDLSVIHPDLPKPSAFAYVLRKLQSEEGINLTDPLTRDSILGFTQSWPSIEDKQVMAAPLLTLEQAMSILALAWTQYRNRDGLKDTDITEADFIVSQSVGTRIAALDARNQQIAGRRQLADNRLTDLRAAAMTGVDVSSEIPSVDELLAE